jgi:hypothetical protein
MINAEILVVTDGITKIDVHEMTDKLGKIKLHVLKIGDEYPELDFYDMKSEFINEKLDFDPSSINIRQIHNLMENPEGQEKPLSIREQRVYRMLIDQSNSIFKDLRKVSRNFIEVADLRPEGLYDVSDDNIKSIERLIEKFEQIDLRRLEIDDKENLYKQVYFLSQYIRMLLEHGKKNKDELRGLYHRLSVIKRRLMEDNELFILIVRLGKYHEDKKQLKLDRKQARQIMKQMASQNKNISLKDMKRAQLTFSFEPGEGNAGKILIFLLIKLFQLIGSVITYPFTR